ncbi:MAG: hypothetical protein IIC06_00030 [Proteobacteria bacterium]|nr:hypothetical protein [Pseudomonadota bacterium]
MDTKQNISKQTVTRLLQDPDGFIEGQIAGVSYRARMAIPGYAEKIAAHYRSLLPAGLTEVCATAAIPFHFPGFGLVCEFEKPVELKIYDADYVLDAGFKEAIGILGPLIFRNAYLAEKCRKETHNQIFPDLNFHVDRSAGQDNQYSLFSRDPFDPVQKAPRRSSTLIAASIVGHLQAMREGQAPPNRRQTLYEVFKDEDLESLTGDILLEQPWTAPEGTGEICLFDNRTLQHASYYRAGRGYPIGVRYLF